MHSMLLRSMALRTKPILLYKSDFNETCLSDLEFKYTSQLRYCRTQIDSGASSVSDGDSRQRTLPICSPRRTTNLPRTYVAQILKRLKECLNQQKIVEISYQESLETPNWLHSGRSYQGAWRTIQPSPETGRSPSFPWASKKKKYLQACPDQRRDFSPFGGFMWRSAWKWSLGSTTNLSRQEIRKVLFRHFKLLKSKMKNIVFGENA